MHAHVWLEGNSVLLLHGTAISRTAYDKRSIFSVQQLRKSYFIESLGNEKHTLSCISNSEIPFFLACLHPLVLFELRSFDLFISSYLVLSIIDI